MSEQNGRAMVLSPAAEPLARGLEMDAARMALLSRTIGADLKPDELQLFMAVAARLRLDPFVKQIHPIKDRQGRFFLHVGIDGRRVIAQRTGLVDGTLGPEWCGQDGQWRDVWLDDSPPAAARFGVLKKGCREPFYAVAHMKGFRQQTGRWATDAPHMLAKVAEDHAWRKAFPYEMGAVPTYRPENDEEGEDAQPSAEYREIDTETGEVLPPAERVPMEWEKIPDEPETPGAPAGPDSSGRSVPTESARQPEPNTAESIEQAFAEEPTGNGGQAAAPPALMAEATALYEKAKTLGVRTPPPHPASTEMGLNSYIAVTRRAITAKQGAMR